MHPKPSSETQNIKESLRWRLGIRAKLLITVNTVLLIGLVGLLTIDFRQGLAEQLYLKQMAMTEEASLVLTAVDALEHHGLDMVQDYIDRACAQMQDSTSPGHHIAIRLDNQTFLQAQTHNRASPAFADAMQKGAQASDHQALILSKSILVGSRRQDDMVVYVSEFTRDIRQSARSQLLSRVGAIALIGFALTAIVNLVLLRLVTRPIGRLVGTVRRIGSGELGIMPQRSTTTELDELALEIGRMSHSLAKEDEYRRCQMAKARRLQLHLMPQADQLNSQNIHHIHLPAEDVGGDFFDVTNLDDHRVAIYMGDVTGHGVPAAMSAVMLKTLFEHSDAQITQPAAVLRRINRQFHAITLDGDFATMIMGILDRKHNRLIYANAGHETGYIINREGHITELDSTGLVLGVDPDAEYDTAEVSINTGDMIVLLTDGLIETMSPQGKTLGRKAFTQTLAQATGQTTHELASSLIRLADNYRSGGPQLDDITLVVLRV